ncbi:hypothetical protein Dsin_013253 [Dipteronia sinensis]|uniref:Endonuclease/exonuclease/phosphatase domain-containing protein n=1 Tax=Dipteronia sinensis TaxID=43782 RepID=A0AAE0AJM6_9ROSI|nr:hypothetical protein Dsin_013253 [Dipteronia sinensis]
MENHNLRRERKGRREDFERRSVTSKVIDVVRSDEAYVSNELKVWGNEKGECVGFPQKKEEVTDSVPSGNPKEFTASITCNQIFVWNARGLGSSRVFNTLRYHKQEVKPEVMLLMETRDSRQKWRYTGFYGNPDQSQRSHSWTLLRRLAGMIDCSWVCMGDFNEIMFDSEKCGGLPKKWRDLASFREVVEECNLEDIENIMRKFQLCGDCLGAWNVEKRINLKQDFITRRNALRNVGNSNMPYSWKELAVLEEKLNAALSTEERYWKQRARIEWLRHGDRNSHFFHVKATARRMRNLIRGIKDDERHWREENEEIKKVI